MPTAPLVVMLVLTQLSVGGFAGRAWSSGWAGSAVASDLSILCDLSLGLGYVGLAASLLHLGRPHLRLPGDSRAAAFVAEPRGRWRSGSSPSWRRLYVAAELLAARLARWPCRGCRLSCCRRWSSPGLAGVVCSVMVYHVVRRPFWRASVERRQVRGHDRSCSGSPRPWRAWLSSSRPSRRHSAGRGRRRRGADRRDGGQALVRGEARPRLADDASSAPLRRTARLLRGAAEAAGRSAGGSSGSSGGVVLPALAIAAAASGDPRRRQRRRRFSRWPSRSPGSWSSVTCSSPRSSRPKMPGGLPS